ncbi:hypothetical protein CMK22_13110 [Candidatus Poribacteria bacterium]|nr:hypothetical protein [Candidatus Poribacteria bacterium]
MLIHDRSYHHWDGQLKSGRVSCWIIIARAELKILAQRKFVRFIVAIPPLIYFVVHGVLVYLVNYFPESTALLKIDPKFFKQFLLRDPVFPGFFVVLISVFAGTNLISKDLKYNALSIYLSKPISWIDYIIGKTSVIVILLLMITGIPCVLLFFEHSLLSNDLKFLVQNYWILGSILVYSLVVVFPLSLLIVTFSSLTTDARYAAVWFIAVLVGTPILQEIIEQVTRSRETEIISIWGNFDALGMQLFGLAPESQIWVWSAAVLVIMMVLCLCVLRRQLRLAHIRN